MAVSNTPSVNQPEAGVKILDFWQVNHVPSTATQATASQAAGASGVRHVCKRITVGVAAGGTAQTPLVFNLRDGATGAGTILWSLALSCIINTCINVDLDHLNLYGSAATAMTIESAAASATAVQAVVSAQGYDIA